MVSALRDVVHDATARVSLLPDDVVVDIGANDGTLLREYPDNIWKIAFEPAQNFDPGADERYGYWPRPEFKTQAKIITSAACFYDVDDPNAFVAAIKGNLAPDGVWINQLAYLPDTVGTNNFGDICHEHLTYWTIGSFNALLERHGLELRHWSHNDVNGGSIRFVVGHGTGQKNVLYAWDPIDQPGWQRFGENINRQRREVIKFLANHTNIVGYGASTKGNTYLQYWGVTSNLVDFIADRNPDKWGKYTPMGQKVISEEQMRAMRPHYLLVLPWHFTEAFVERERDLLAQGARLIVPFPRLHLIGGDAHPDLSAESTVSDSRAAV